MYLFSSIRKDLIEDCKISDEAFFVYVGLTLVCNVNYPESEFETNSSLAVFSSKSIEYALFDREANTREKKKIKNGIDCLINKKFIDVVHKSSNFYVCNCEKLKKKDKFVGSDKKSHELKIPRNVIVRLSNLNVNKNKMKLFRYYHFLMSMLSLSNDKYGGKIGNVPKVVIQKTASVSLETMEEYNKILKDNKFIYIYQTQKIFTKNVYSRYEDIELCKEWIRENYKIEPIEKRISTARQFASSALWIEKWFKEGNIEKINKYSTAEILDIRSFIVEYNSRNEEDYKKHPNKKQIAKKYDVGVFDEILKERSLNF